MKFRSLATAAASLALVGSVAVAGPADAAEGDPTFTEILAAQGGGTDRNWYDFDILAAGITAAGLDGALDAQPEVTVFLPNDRAFQALVADLFGWRYWFANEAKILEKVASLGPETLKTVILYHAVPATIDSATALSVDRGTALPTLLEGNEIRVFPKARFGTAVLADNDLNDVNPLLVRSKLDIKAKNGFAHGISFVLRPIDL
jgi:uncharacterized surface protein with fasciclin (FAS1) repeats